MLIIDIADDFLKDILQRHDALKITIFINDNGEMLTACAEGLKLVEQQGGLRNEIRVAGDILDKFPPGGGTAAGNGFGGRLLANGAKQVLDVKDADDGVGIAGLDRVAGMRRCQDLAKKRVQVIIGIDHLHAGAVCHDLLDADLVQVQNR